MSIKKLDEYDDLVADELRDYARRRRFTAELTDSLAATMLRSIEGGDGAIWTDSLLVSCLLSDRSALRTLFDRVPGFRSWAVADDDFQSTLSTQHLVPRASLTTTLDDEVRRHLSLHTTPLTEATLLELELDLALSQFADNNTELAFFIREVSRPINKLADAIGNGQSAQSLRRMAGILEDCIWISMMAVRHPFSALASIPQNLVCNERKPEDGNVRSSPYVQLGETFTGSRFDRARRIFYWRLRETAHVSPRVLGDEELLEVANSFDRKSFCDVCDGLAELYFDEFAEDEDERDTGGRLWEMNLHASSMLWSQEFSLALIAQRLESWRFSFDENSWPLTSKVLVSLGERQIEVMRCDVSTDTGFRDADARRGIELAQVGIWTPGPIWTDTVLDRLKHLINMPTVSEQQLQYFFEAYPEFILDELHAEAFPQVVLYQDHGPNLRPDFVVRRTGTDFIDIVDLKLPKARLVTGRRDRPSPANEIVKGISQLKQYREWFRSPSNQRKFRNKYGLQGFEPRLTLVIGRQSPFLDPVVKARAFSGAEAKIVTYDEIYDTVRRRREWLFP